MIHALGADTAGSALLEATLVTPFLLFVFLGVYEFSWYFNRQQLVVSGVRDAARYLAAASANPCTNATIQANAKNIAVTGTVDGSGTPRVQTPTVPPTAAWTTADITIGCATIDNSANSYYCPDTPGNCYTVTVSTTFPDPDLGFFPFLGLTTPNISASHTERANQGAPP